MKIIIIILNLIYFSVGFSISKGDFFNKYFKIDFLYHMDFILTIKININNYLKIKTKK